LKEEEKKNTYLELREDARRQPPHPALNCYPASPTKGGQKGIDYRTAQPVQPTTFSAMFRSALRIPRQAVGAGLAQRASTTAPAFVARRHLHNVPSLPHDYVEGGIPNLMSPGGFALAWTDYQGLMVEKLNALTAGTSFALSVLGRTMV
jgi:hypothetical protein